MTTHYKRSILISSIVIVVTFIVSLGALYVLGNELNARAAHIRETRALIARRSATREALAGLRSLSPRAEVYAREIERLLPPHDELLQFREWLEGFARVYNVELSFGFQGAESPPSETQAGFAGFSISLVGDYSDVFRFARELEESPQGFLIALDGFNATRVGGNRFRVISGGRVYFR